jgi:leucine dehydrogenase
MAHEGHEQLLICSDPAVGLKAFIAIHDTTLGPACGGVRIWPHETEDAAVEDVLRLSKAMTYKSALASLDLGGGKALIMADPRTDKSEALFRSFGRSLDTLGGKFIVAEDVGATPADMVHVAKETDHVVGLPIEHGGSGETSIMTGLGVYLGMKACAREKWGSDSLEGHTVAIQGYGHVAENLAPYLVDEGADLVVTDIFPDAIQRAEALGARTVTPNEIYDVDCDIFSPNALGGALNPRTIPALKCGVVAGGANNQLSSPKDAESLARRGILYAPDYVINAGGIINASCEVGMDYDEQLARRKTEGIYDTIQRVLRKAAADSITTAQAADLLAQARLQQARATLP